MKAKNKKEKCNSNENSFLMAIDTVFDYLGIKRIDEVTEKIVSFAKEEPQKFYSFGSVIVMLLLCIIKSAKFYYVKGVFSIYSISDTYVDVNENTVFQFIMDVFVVLLILLSNICYLSIIVSHSKNKLIGVLRHLFFYLIEITIMFTVICVETHNNLGDIIHDPTFSSLERIIIFIVSLFVSIFVINIFAIMIALENKEKCKSKARIGENENDDQVIEELNRVPANRENLLTYVVSIILLMSLIPMSYFCGKRTEYERNEYKLCKLNYENYCIDNEIGLLKLSEKNAAFAVVYENSDIYLVCPVCVDSLGENVIDTSVSLIIDKKGVVVYNRRIDRKQ